MQRLSETSQNRYIILLLRGSDSDVYKTCDAEFI